MVAFRDFCASELCNTVKLTRRRYIQCACQTIKCGQSLVYSTASLLFFAIVAVVEVEVGI